MEGEVQGSVMCFKHFSSMLQACNVFGLLLSKKKKKCLACSSEVNPVPCASPEKEQYYIQLEGEPHFAVPFSLFFVVHDGHDSTVKMTFE